MSRLETGRVQTTVGKTREPVEVIKKSYNEKDKVKLYGGINVEKYKAPNMVDNTKREPIVSKEANDYTRNNHKTPKYHTSKEEHDEPIRINKKRERDRQNVMSMERQRNKQNNRTNSRKKDGHSERGHKIKIKSIFNQPKKNITKKPTYDYSRPGSQQVNNHLPVIAQSSNQVKTNHRQSSVPLKLLPNKYIGNSNSGNQYGKYNEQKAKKMYERQGSNRYSVPTKNVSKEVNKKHNPPVNSYLPNLNPSNKREVYSMEVKKRDYLYQNQSYNYLKNNRKDYDYQIKNKDLYSYLNNMKYENPVQKYCPIKDYYSPKNDYIKSPEVYQKYEGHLSPKRDYVYPRGYNYQAKNDAPAKYPSYGALERLENVKGLLERDCVKYEVNRYYPRSDLCSIRSDLKRYYGN